MTVREGTVLERIDALIAERHLLKHPVYTKWREGTLSREALQEYARQYYTFESAFPRLARQSSALAARVPAPSVGAPPRVRGCRRSAVDPGQPVGRGARRGQPR